MVVVVHRGARDAYQVAGALQDAGLLSCLVTDLYWPLDRKWERLLPARIKRLARSRSQASIPARKTKLCAISGIYSTVTGKVGLLPSRWQSSAIRWSDTCLGRTAGRLAVRRNCALLSYSYYGHSAFTNCSPDVPKILFQLHPHPLSVRKILNEEMARHPEMSDSVRSEWELALPESDFDRLVAETTMPQHWIAASSFTRRTLVDNGIPDDRVRVIPYGIDLDEFSSRDHDLYSQNRPLKILFVGRINARKGIQYLIDALDLLRTTAVELVICGWAVGDYSYLKRYKGNIRVVPSASAAELLNEYRSADLFVLPSLAEGFAQVLLEAMASGLPVISTTNTALPDLIENGREGFIVPPADAVALAERIQWVLDHRSRLGEMGRAARRRAEHFTWARFRNEVASVVQEMIVEKCPEGAGLAELHV